ncbi:MAG TPA: hypothetical protein VNH22_01560 [Blastocatellia bacterium]|jgi:endogenous inhibitor of DNA gyrase (YacG/DUF329 family)|nr:hypothetical protein [Blastocatellia bacterium]
MAKRRYISEDDPEDDGYTEAECPECGAPLTVRFQKGRRSRRLNCPVCLKKVTLSRDGEASEPPLIQLRGPGGDPFPPSELRPATRNKWSKKT